MRVASILLLSALAEAALFEERDAANPIRKVVTMLQNMQTKLEAEGKKQEALFHKFMCYCQTSGGALSGSISAANNKISSLNSELEAATEKKAQTEADLKKHQDARADAKKAMSEATNVREKEASAFAKFKGDSEANIAALAKATAAVEKGMGGSFLQTQSAQMIRTFAIDKATLSDSARQELLSFLSGTESYAPASGEIVGILKQMGDEMNAALADATKVENDAIASYDGLISAKTKEVSILTEQIENELKRIGDLGVLLATGANDLEDTKEALAADQEFQAGLEQSCKTKEAEWEEIKRTRAQEQLALADTIKVLNDDDALELFKKTLPSASSFVQVEVSAAATKAKALAILRSANSQRPDMDLIEMAMSSKKIGFGKVITMIDNMVANLEKEQSNDNDKKEYCDKEFDLSDDKKKQLELSIADSETAIEEMKGSIATTTQEIADLEAGIAATDKSVTEATAQRKEENADFKDLIASDTTAKELLLFAKNRLNKFYNPKLYKAPAKRDLSEEDRLVVNNGGTLAPTTIGGIAGTGISFAQLASHRSDVAPPPPPETFGAYQKKSEDGNGVIEMIDLLVADLDKEMTEAKTDEQNSQEAYGKMVAQAGRKRAEDSKSLTEKRAAKADLEQSLEDEQDTKASTQKELGGTLKFIHSLHGECDWLLKYFEVRKSARTEEIDALGKAKAVLSGADYSLMQTQAARNRGFLAH